jgi:type I restriction enzyme M protein
MSDVVQKLWGFCHVLRHDGIDYGDYIEQITYLLFIKMADERGVELPKGCSWPQLEAESGSDLTDHYADALRTLGKQPGILGDIFAGSMPRFSNPVNLKRLITLIDETEWTALDKDVKAEAFEGLLEKAAAEGKKGAGQYFTSRVVIQSICRVMKPDPRPRADITICDPAVGTAGFLVCAYEWLLEQTKGALDRDVAKRIRTKTYFGQELVARPRRLALMNLFLHGLETHHLPRRHDLRSARVPAIRHHPDEPSVRDQGRKSSPGSRGLHHRDLEQAVELLAAHPDRTEAGRSRRRCPARQLSVRRSGG